MNAGGDLGQDLCGTPTPRGEGEAKSVPGEERGAAKASQHHRRCVVREDGSNRAVGRAAPHPGYLAVHGHKVLDRQVHLRGGYPHRESRILCPCSSQVLLPFGKTSCQTMDLPQLHLIELAGRTGALNRESAHRIFSFPGSLISIGILNRSSRRVKGLEPGSKKTKPPAGASTAG